MSFLDAEYICIKKKIFWKVQIYFFIQIYTLRIFRPMRSNVHLRKWNRLAFYRRENETLNTSAHSIYRFLWACTNSPFWKVIAFIFRNKTRTLCLLRNFVILHFSRISDSIPAGFETQDYVLVIIKVPILLSFAEWSTCQSTSIRTTAKTITMNSKYLKIILYVLWEYY